MKEGFGNNTSDQEFKILVKVQFLRRPPVKKVVPLWSLAIALKSLQHRRFNCREKHLKSAFMKSSILFALASGNRLSQLATLDRDSVIFVKYKLAVSLLVRPGFLFKN